MVCGRQRNAEMAGLLVSFGADWRLSNRLGDSALGEWHIAVAQRNGNYEIALLFTGESS